MTTARSAVLLMILLCMALPAPLHAAPVRALEHPEFSRLLLPVPPAVDWSLQHDGRSAQLALRGPVPALELDAIFDRMPRSRIRSVDATTVADGATLTLQLGCECELVVERLGDMLLAVDVRSPGSVAPPAVPQRAAPLPKPAGPGAEPAATRPAPLGSPDFAAPGATRTAETTPAAVEPARPEGAKFLSVAPGRQPAVAALPEADDPVRLARAALVRQLERAAAEGLVELAPDVAEATRALTAARPEPAPLDLPLPDAALLPRLTSEPIGEAARPRVPNAGPAARAAETASPPPPSVGTPPPAAAAPPQQETPEPEPSTDSLLAHLTARAPVPPPAHASDAPDPCAADAALDIRFWPQAGDDPTGALGQMRRVLYTESGELDAAAVRDLARLYISIGFGREAAALLEAAGLAARPEPLHDLSLLVEGRAPASDGPVLGAAGCGGRILLWRAVAGAEPLDQDAAAWPAIREGLMELPPRLRRLVGQELARQALLGDRPAAAREIIDLLDRTPGAEPQMETRVRAALAIARGEAQYALTLVGPEIEERASPDPEALLLQARATLAAGLPPAPAVMTMLDTAIPNYEAGAPVGRALRLVRARLEAAAGRPAVALDMIQEVLAASGGRNGDAIATGRGILAGLPPEARSGPVGARVILAHRNLLDKGAESRALRLGYAEALIEGGLPNAALRLLSSPRILKDRDTRLVAARAHLLLGEDDAVFQMLDGLKDTEAARLRSTVHRRAGDMAAAHAELAALSDSDAERNATALLAGAWKGLDARAVAAPLAPLAAYAADQPPADPAAGRADGVAAQNMPTLDAAQAALAEAQRLREAFGVAGPGS